MDIPEIKALGEKYGDVQIIVTFLDEAHMTVGVKIIQYGFGRPSYGDYMLLGPGEHTEKKIRQTVDLLFSKLKNVMEMVDHGAPLQEV